jgi:DME family drug/metabolite transporter
MKLGIFFVTVAAVAWGMGGVVASILYRTSGMGPLAVSFWRAALGVAVLAGVQVVRRRPIRVRILAGGWRIAIIGIGLAVYQSAYYGSIAEVGVAVGTVATLGACPITVALAGRWFLRERLESRAMLAIAAAVAGLALLVGKPGAIGPNPLLGMGSALLSAIGYATVTLVSGASSETEARSGGDAYGIGTTLESFIVGALCLLPLALFEGIAPQAHLPATAGWLMFLGAVPTALAYTMFFVGLRSVPATLASVLVLIEPVSAMALAVGLLGERLTITALAGALLMLGAVFALSRGLAGAPST